jgi:hypothetical protein
MELIPPIWAEDAWEVDVWEDGTWATELPDPPEGGVMLMMGVG